MTHHHTLPLHVDASCKLQKWTQRGASSSAYLVGGGGEASALRVE